MLGSKLIILAVFLLITISKASGEECKSCSSTSKVCCNPRLGQMCPDGTECCQCAFVACECGGKIPPTPPPAPPVRPTIKGDIIIIGMGAAGTVLVDKLSESLPNKSIIVIESGGMVSGRVSSEKHHTTQPTVFNLNGVNYTASDIPGLYPSIAFNPLYDDVKQSQHPWTWLGKSLGGNTMFNGMLWMEPSSSQFKKWGGPWADGLSAELSKVKETLRVSQRPSPDGKLYSGGVSSLNLSLGLEGVPFTAVATDGGRNSTHAYLNRILQRPNVNIISDCSVDFIEAGSKTVSFTCNRTPNNLAIANDRIILSAGTLGSATILHKSGLDQLIAPVSDHAGAAVEVECQNTNSFNFKDLTSGYAKQYIDHGTGPFAQYGPVYVDNDRGFEIFINPFGMSKESSNKSIGIYAMLMTPKVKGDLQFDGSGNTRYPNIYLRGSGKWAALGQEDMMAMAGNFSRFYESFLTNNTNCIPTVGPGSPLTPNLKPGSVSDMITYLGYDVSPGRPDAHISHLIMNHFTGTIPLGISIDPNTLILKGLNNIHVADASIIPEPLDAHPVATVMAIGLKAADIILKQIKQS